jgi:hypothetical protein
VAMPLGSGYSAEEQLTGKAEHGGLQIIVYPMKREAYEEHARAYRPIARQTLRSAMSLSDEMGFAPGGRMRQKIYADPYTLEDWDLRVTSRCFVPREFPAWQQITDQAPPTKPPRRGLHQCRASWFDFTTSP